MPQAKSPTSPDDAAIIRRSCANPASFAELFERHAPLIFRYLARRVGECNADDLLVETFLAAFRRRDQYDASYRDARPWLYGIASNLVGQHRRDESRLLRIRVAEDSALPVSEQSHADWVTTKALASSVTELLAAVVADLPQVERDVLLLIAWEQLSYEEVAQALDVPVGTVRSRLSRARARIREALATTHEIETLKEILNDD